MLSYNELFMILTGKFKICLSFPYIKYIYIYIYYQNLHTICCMDKSLHFPTDSISIYTVPVDKKRLTQPNIEPVLLCLHHCFILKQCPYK